jgi:hypothetical protein
MPNIGEPITNPLNSTATYNGATGTWTAPGGQQLVAAPPQQVGQLSETGDASDLSAEVLQGEMQNWESTYKPVELNLLGQSSLNNPNVLPNAVSDATGTATAENTAMAGVATRQLASRGITATPGQTTAINRMQNLSGAANIAGAQNQARQNVMTQDEMIALGSAPNPVSAMNVANVTANAKAMGG